MTRPRIALIHATPVAVEPVNDSFAALWPEAEPVNLLDDVLAIDRSREVGLAPDIRRRISDLADYGRSIGAKAILFTCSAFGPAIDDVARRFEIPVLKPNEAMFEEALAYGDRIGMIATFGPAVAMMEAEFAEEKRRLRPSATLTTALAPDALTALRAGDASTHNRLVAAHAGQMTGVAAIMLAHFSTSRALQDSRSVASVPVLSSPDAAVRKTRRLLEGARA